MKKGLIFATTLAMALGVGVAVGAHQAQAKPAEALSGGDTVYLDPGVWAADNAWFAVYTFGSTNDWVKMTPVEGESVYSATLHATNTSMIFCRMNKNDTSTLDWSNKWDQSVDLTYASASTNNMYKITDWGSGGVGVGTWDSFSSKVEPSTKENEFYIHDLSGEFATKANVKIYGWGQPSNVKDDAWPGKYFSLDTATLGATSVYTAGLSESFTKFVVNSGSKQTADVEDLGDNIGKVLVIKSDTDGSGHHITEWRETSYYTDYPAADGYYLVGSKTNWSFSGAPALEADSVDGEHNHARLIRYSATKDEEFKVYGYFNGERSYFGYHKDSEHDQENYKVAATGLANIWCSKDGHIYVEENVPAADGYYIQGSVIGWNYEDALVMTETSQDGNLAYYMGLTVAIDDEIRPVRYLTSQVTFEQYANVGNTKIVIDDEEVSIGEISNNNLKFTRAGKYDIYFKEENSELKFYVAEHVDTYSVEMTGVKFVGGEKEGTVNQESQLAYSTSNFEPVQPVMNGYVVRGYFTDEDCLTPYVPEKISELGHHLYAKYTKIGYYVIHGPDYSIDDAVPMLVGSGIGEGNQAEASVVVENKGECYSFVFYDSNGEMQGHSGLGKTYAYAEDEQTHIKFKETGTYAVYWSKPAEQGGDNKIYLNDGSTAFCTNFLSATGNECKVSEQGAVTTDVDALRIVWAAQKVAFQALSDGAKAEIKAVAYDEGDEHGTVIEQMVARYHYITWKYGSALFEDFIYEEINIPAHNVGFIGGLNTIASVDNTIIIVVAIAATSALAFGVALYLKKRKQK